MNRLQAIALPPKWACGAAGSALPWHGRGRRFDPDQVHQFFRPLADTSFELGAAWCQNALTEPGRLHPPHSLLLRVRAAHFLAHRSEGGVNDNIRPGAVNDRLQLGLLLSR